MAELEAWWRITITAADPDVASGLLWALGISGLESAPDGDLIASFYGTDQALREFLQGLKDLNLQHALPERVIERNWVLESSAAWTPLQIGALSITPVVDPHGAPEPVENEILLHPAAGFGTGHHATTRMVLELMQRVAPEPKCVLDYGAGSAVLAIAAARLWGAQVIATEIDHDAVQNAHHNCALNRCEKLVSVLEGVYTKFDRRFELIVANIYAEVLVELRSVFETAITEGGSLIVSGIMTSLADSVLEGYCARGWVLKERLDRDGWVALQWQAPQG